MARIRARAVGGFTLVEVVLASIVVVISIIGIISAIVWSQQAGLAAREKLQAQNAAHQVLEQIRAQQNGLTLAAAPAFVAQWNGFTFWARPSGASPPNPATPAPATPPVDRLDGSPAVGGRGGRVTVANAVPNGTLLDVNVSFTWKGAAGRGEVHFRTYVQVTP